MKPVVLGVIGVALCSGLAVIAKFTTLLTPFTMQLSPLTMQLTPRPQQIAGMQSGVAAVDDTAAASSVRLVQPEGGLEKRNEIQLLVMNKGGKPFNFGPENVTAKLADGTPVAIIPYEQLALEEQRGERSAELAAAWGALNRSLITQATDHVGSNPDTLSSDVDQTESAQQQALDQSYESSERVAEQKAANRKALKAYMRTTTVRPQQMFE